GYIGKVLNDDHVVLLSKNEEGVGEISVKGVNVMSGYYNNPELNKEAFTADGYFKTGDLGAFDKKGRLAIMGRVKTMILGPGGENIYPESIESVINNMSFVQESLVVPENGGLLALIKIDLKAFAEKKMLDTKQAKDEAIKYIASLRKDINAQLSSFSRIDDVELQEEEFERTPSQKIKRFLYSSGDKRKKQSEKNSVPVQNVKSVEEKKAAEPKPAKPAKSEIAKEREELILKYKDSVIQEKKNWQIEKEKIRAERKLLDQRYQEAKTARKENLEKAKARFKKQKSKLKG
ncbi:MAG: AMP-binding protein, partial [Spirochaetales bacterium]|nr:AMP-binding protein [Spirochaetales bacterium]